MTVFGDERRLRAWTFHEARSRNWLKMSQDFEFRPSGWTQPNCGVNADCCTAATILSGGPAAVTIPIASADRGRSQLVKSRAY
jgi:hypothetical protein